MADYELEALLAESQAHINAGDISAGLRKSRLAFDLAKNRLQLNLAAAALLAQAKAHFRLGHYSETADLAHQAVQQTEAGADTETVESADQRNSIRAQACLLLGQCAAETDDLPMSENYLHQTIELCRMSGEVDLLIHGLHSMSAGIYMPRGQYALALAADAEALALARANNTAGIVWAPLTTMSWVCFLSGQYEHASDLLQQLRGAAQAGSLGDGWAHNIQAWLALTSGDLPAASTDFGRTRSIGEKIGSPELNFYARLGMAQVCRKSGETASAINWAADATDVARRIGYRHLHGMAEVESGRCTWQQGDLAAAENHFRTALEILTPLQTRLEISQAYLALAALLLAQNRPASDAVRSALELIHSAGFYFLVDQERPWLFAAAAAGLNSRDPSLTEIAGRVVKTLQRLPAPSLRVKTLGGLQVWQGARLVQPKALNLRRAGELLVLLLASPGQQLTLEETAERLWSDGTPTSGRDLLHQATSALRHALEPELPTRFPSRYLLVEDGSLKILSASAPDLASWVDFAAFENAIGQGKWETALELYTGDFMPGSPYAEWTIPLRQHFITQYQQTLLEAAHRRYAAGNFAGALTLCQRLQEIEPWQEQAVLVGMHAALALKDVATARRMYQTLKKTLEIELGVAPQPELQELFRSL